MIRSMTGYGKIVFEWNGHPVSIEVRALNSKYSDFGLRIPVNFRSSELEIRNLLNQVLVRGKVDLTIMEGDGITHVHQQINKEAVTRYYQELKALSNELKSESDILPIVMRIPDVFL